MSWLTTRFPLVPLMLALAALELLFFRIGLKLVHGKLPGIDQVIQGTVFVVNLLGALAVVIFTWAAVVCVKEQKAFGAVGRWIFAPVSALFLIFAALASFSAPSPLIKAVLSLSFGLWLLVAVVLFLFRPAPIRAKLGVLFFAVPLLLHLLYGLPRQLSPLLLQLGLRLDREFYLIARWALDASVKWVVVGGFAAFVFFAPKPRWANLIAPFPVGIAVFFTALVGLLMSMDPLLAKNSAYFGLGLNVNLRPVEIAIYSTAVFFFFVTVANLLWQRGIFANAGAGLLLLGLCGIGNWHPHQFLLAALGLLLLLRYALAEGAGALNAGEGAVQSLIPSPLSFKSFLERVAGACGLTQTETVALQNDRSHVFRLRGQKGALPVALRVLCQANGIEELELWVGRPPKGKPAATLVRKKGRRGLRVSGGRGSRVPVDPQFVVRDGGQRAADLFLAQQLRNRLFRSAHGVVSLWPGEAVHYRARPLPDGWPLPLAALVTAPERAETAELQALIEMLVGLAELAQVSV